MNWRKKIAIVLTALILFTVNNVSAKKNQLSSATTVNVVTEEIQAGIEKHIAQQIALGKGYFELTLNGQVLQLKLVRVHTEYLAKLGPQHHFACVDLANIDGNVYDVDFFLTGEAGEMSVTETTVHKVNGRPLYAWEQKRDKTWHRTPMKGAPPDLLGVIKGRDEFEFIYRAKLPPLDDKARLWIPIPTTDSFQIVDVISIKAPGQQKILQDSKHGNSILFLDLKPQDSGQMVELRFQVQRLEKGVYVAPTPLTPGQYLSPDRLVPANESFHTIAKGIVEGKPGELSRTRALYDHVIESMRYIKHGSGWGQGDAVYACDVRTGNCTDFHSYFIALCRAIGIPARFAIGASIPSARDAGRIGGYHCWAEFYTAGSWWPVDISEGNKNSSLSAYYFGHHPANRIEFSRGRDLVVEPGPASGPINFLAYPVLEIDGKPAKVKVEFSFKRKTNGNR